MCKNNHFSVRNQEKTQKNHSTHDGEETTIIIEKDGCLIKKCYLRTLLWIDRLWDCLHMPEGGGKIWHELVIHHWETEQEIWGMVVLYGIGFVLGLLFLVLDFSCSTPDSANKRIVGHYISSAFPSQNRTAELEIPGVCVAMRCHFILILSVITLEP